MAYPTDILVTGELVTAAQINRWEVMLADSTLTAPAASFDFTSIPAHWSHLRIVLYARGDNASTSTAVMVRFNGDATAQYDYQYLRAVDATVDGSAVLAQPNIYAGDVPCATAPANSFAPVTIDIPHYADASNHQVLLFQNFRKRGTLVGDFGVISGGGLWRITTLISRVTLLPAAGNFAIGSRATLYGKGRI